MSATAALLALGALGLANTFAGYRIFLFMLALAGALLGGFIVLTLASFVAPGPIALGIATVFAIASGWLAVKLYKAGVVVLGITLGVVVAIALAPGFHAVWRALALGVSAVLGGALAIPLQRFVIVVGTSVQGSLSAVLTGVILYEGGDLVGYRRAWALLLSGEESIGQVLQHPGIVALWVVLAVVGVVMQLVGGHDDEQARTAAADDA